MPDCADHCRCNYPEEKSPERPHELGTTPANKIASAIQKRTSIRPAQGLSQRRSTGWIILQHYRYFGIKCTESNQLKRSVTFYFRCTIKCSPSILSQRIVANRRLRYISPEQSIPLPPALSSERKTCPTNSSCVAKCVPPFLIMCELVI